MTTRCVCGHAKSQHPKNSPCDYDGYACLCKQYRRLLTDDTKLRTERENMTKKYEKSEFAFGFIVLYNGKRIALVVDEDAADAVIASGKKHK